MLVYPSSGEADRQQDEEEVAAADDWREISRSEKKKNPISATHTSRWNWCRGWYNKGPEDRRLSRVNTVSGTMHHPVAR